MTELVKKQETALEVKQETTDLATFDSGLSQSDGFTDSKDIIIPKIGLMQGLSKAVADEIAQMGEMRDNTDNRLLGSRDNPLEAIPFFQTSTWMDFEAKQEKGKQKLEYLGQYTRNNANKDLPLEEFCQETKRQIIRHKNLNFYFLLPQDIEEGLPFPYLINFRLTSYYAGRKLVSAAEKLAMFRKYMFAQTSKLVCERRQNDDGTFYVWDRQAGRKTTPEEQAAAIEWMKKFQTMNIVNNDSDLVDTVEEKPAIKPAPAVVQDVPVEASQNRENPAPATLDDPDY